MIRNRCPECWGPTEYPPEDLCKDCINEIDAKEEHLEREHISNESFQFRSQLL